MKLSPYAELRAIKDARGCLPFISIKDAIKAIEEVKNKVSNRRGKAIDLQIDKMLRDSEIEKCKLILKEIEC